MNYCTKCGQPVAEGAKFCNHCGAPVNTGGTKPVCPKCGHPLEANEKFCSVCGAPVQTEKVPPAKPPTPSMPPQPEKKKKAQYTKEGRKIIDSGPKPASGPGSPPKSRPTRKPAARNSAAPPAKKKKNGCLGCLGKSIIGILALLVIGIAIIYFLPDDQQKESLETGSSGIIANRKNTRKKYDKSNLKTRAVLIETTVNTDTAEVFIRASDNISLVLPIALLDNSKDLTVKKLDPIQLPFEGGKCENVIEVTLGDQHQFDDFIEIQGPPPSGFNPQTDIIKCYSISKNDEHWKPVMAYYDADKGKVRIFTDHLSVFAYQPDVKDVVKNIIEPMYVISEATYNYWYTIASHDEVKILDGYSSYHINKQLNKDYYVTSWNTVMELYGLEGAGLTFLEHGLDMSGLSNLNEAILRVGVGMALIQAALDANNGNGTKAKLDLTKTFFNTAVSKIFNTRAMNLAFVGIFAIDYSLTTFANEAWAGRENTYRHVFDQYQYIQRKHKKGLRWWKKQILLRMNEKKDPSKFESVVEQLIKEYIREFWDDNTERAIIQAELQGHGWSYNGGYSQKLKDKLDPEFRIYILQYIQPLIERLQKRFIFKARESQQEEIKKLANKLNREHLIRCSVELGKDENPGKYEGLKVKFKVAGKELIKFWQGILNQDARMDFPCTEAGFIGGGCPSEATLYIPEKGNLDKLRKITANFSLNKVGKSTKVIFKESLSKILNAGISINIEGMFKSISNTTTTYHDARNFSTGVSFKDSKVDGNTITVNDNYLDGKTHISVMLKLTFEDINNPNKILRFVLKMVEKSGINSYKSNTLVTGAGIPFTTRKVNNNIDFRYEGNISEYTNIQHSWSENYGVANTVKLISLDPKGSVQILLELKE